MDSETHPFFSRISLSALKQSKNSMKTKHFRLSLLLSIMFLQSVGIALCDEPENYRELIFKTPQLKPIDSELKVKIGESAPDFTLPSIQGEDITLSQYRENKNVILSFVPAAWTPVCSDQWPGYIFTKNLFENLDAIVLGITVDNIPTLHAWTRQMGDLWFPVLSDFWPHGAVAEKYGILRTDGVTERALIIIDKVGIIRYIHVENINKRPPLDIIVQALKKINNRDD